MTTENRVYVAARVSPELAERLKAQAEANERTLAAELRIIIKQALEAR